MRVSLLASLFASLVVSLVACIDRVPTADDDPSDLAAPDSERLDAAPRDQRAPDVEPPPPPPDGEWTVFDPGAPITTPETLAVFEPDFDAAPRSIMQGGGHQLIWAGDRYVLLWMQNLGGAIQAVGMTVRDGRASPLTQLTTADDPDQPRSKDRVRGIWRDGRVIVFWTGDAGLWMQAFDADLRPVEPVVRVRDPQADGFLSLHAIEPTDFGFAIVHGLFDEEYRPRLMQLDAGGGVLGDSPIFGPRNEEREPVIVGLRPVEDGYDTLWSQRRAGDVDDVFRAWLDRSGVLRDRTGPLYTSQNNIPQVFGAGLGVPFMGVDDLDDGLLFFQLDEQERPTPRRIADSGGARIVHAPGTTRIALVRETGEAAGGLPSGLTYQAYDYLEATLGAAHPLVEFDGCLEDFDVVFTGDRLGVSYALGCSTRRLYLREVQVR